MPRPFSSRILGYGALGAGLVVALAVGIAAFQSLQVPQESPSASSPTPAVGCNPAPCANVRGYTLWVSNLNREADEVTMQITFRNSSQATHADPSDLELIDSARQPSHPDFSRPDCTQWSRHKFSDGAMYGPLTLCFKVTTTSPPLILRWSPDFGLFCCQTDIKLG
ncbi:MAG TPA: hypothetical protein VGK42_09790 [Candidatus Dormibacteraeota bacterium]